MLLLADISNPLDLHLIPPQKEGEQIEFDQDVSMYFLTCWNTQPACRSNSVTGPSYLWNFGTPLSRKAVACCQFG